jgi:hypothetical protein
MNFGTIGHVEYSKKALPAAITVYFAKKFGDYDDIDNALGLYTFPAWLCPKPANTSFLEHP